jgi:hypothetical protein
MRPTCAADRADVEHRVSRFVAPARLRLHRPTIWLLALLIGGLLVGAADAQSLPIPTFPASDEAVIDRYEERLRLLEEQNQRLSQQIWQVEEQLHRPSLTCPDPTAAPGCVHDVTAEDYRVGYDNGFVLVPGDASSSPFSLKINSQNMIRYSSFIRDEDFWIDASGNQNAITNSSSFQIPRGRLIFSGQALVPELSYLLSFDYNTVTSNPIGFRAYELAYRFNRGLEIHAGLGKVPGTREWIESGFAALEGPDRSMATTFFRPSLSQGVWITGEPIDHLFYHAMVSNGFNTLNLQPGQINDRHCWSGSVWWEPWGDFGRGYSDFEHHDDPVIRLGGCYTFGLGQGQQTDGNGVENSLTRLSDGTLVNQVGALAPGVSVVSYDLSLTTLDAAIKYRGLSLSSEFFAQNLTQVEGTGPLPVDSLQMYGGLLQGGCFVVPGRVELYSRTSLVTGRNGSGYEAAGGLNWFILPNKSNLRFTIDAAWLDSSPASQSRTGYVAGQTGTLIRTQITAVY